MCSSLKDAMPTECPLPPTSKMSDTILSRLSNPLYLKIESTGDSFSPEKRCALPILSSFREREAGFLCDDIRGARNGVERAVSFGVPHRGFELALLVVIGEIAAFLLQRVEELVVDRGLHQQVAVAGAT